MLHYSNAKVLSLSLPLLLQLLQLFTRKVDGDDEIAQTQAGLFHRICDVGERIEMIDERLERLGGLIYLAGAEHHVEQTRVLESTTLSLRA